MVEIRDSFLVPAGLFATVIDPRGGLAEDRRRDDDRAEPFPDEDVAQAAVGELLEPAAAVAVATPPGAAITVAVNVLPDDLLDDDLLDPTSPLGRHAARIFFDISERSALAATPAWRQRIDALRERGYRFAIDDVGAGFLGAAAFDAVRPAAIKIDGLLMRDIHLSALKQRTVAALCSLAHQARRARRTSSARSRSGRRVPCENVSSARKPR